MPLGSSRWISQLQVHWLAFFLSGCTYQRSSGATTALPANRFGPSSSRRVPGRTMRVVRFEVTPPAVTGYVPYGLVTCWNELLPEYGGTRFMMVKLLKCAVAAYHPEPARITHFFAGLQARPTRGIT